MTKSPDEKAKEFEKWLRDYMIACIRYVDLYGGAVDGEREVVDIVAKVKKLLEE